jgi:RNA-directed DNA polymerase
LGNLATPPSVQRLQTALHAKAKENPSFRFYALYDKLYRADVLRYAYACCKAHHGAAGVDGEWVRGHRDVRAGPVAGELAQELSNNTYQPQAVRRVFIPKRDGRGLRALSIAPIRDRLAQAAAKLVLEPIFDA